MKALALDDRLKFWLVRSKTDTDPAPPDYGQVHVTQLNTAICRVVGGEEPILQESDADA
jgi:hypothetical protein